MGRLHNVMKGLLSVFLIAALLILGLPVAPASAASGLTGIGLAEHGLQAYRDGWQYNYGSYGEKNASGVRQSDCSGLVFSYLCWTGEDSDPSQNWNMPRTASQQFQNCSETGPISTLPRTHGVLLFYQVGDNDCDHVGIYVGNGKSVDNSSYGVNMRYMEVSNYRKWNTWGKLSCVEYPTEGWYEFDGSPYYYENGEYVVDTTRTIDGVSYSFDSAGVPSPLPGDYTSSDSSLPDNVSVSAKTTTAVNLRSGAGLGYSVITVVSAGENITILNQDSPSWYKVKLSDGTTGYMCADYIQKDSDTESGDTQQLNILAETTANVNLREGQSTSSPVILTVPTGTGLTITDKSNASWYGVRLNDGTAGYMYASYLRESGSSDAVSPSTGYKAKTTAYVNLRSQATTASPSLLVVDEGAWVTVTDDSNKEWYKVSLSNGKSGYIYSQYLQKASQESGESSGTQESAEGRTTAYVNFRSSPEILGNNVISVIPSGAKVSVLGSANSSWYKVSYNGKEGYLFAEYVQTADSALKAVTTAYVNLREQPSMSGAVQLVVSQGTTVTVLSRDNSEWYQVKLASGRTGYIFAEYLKL